MEWSDVVPHLTGVASLATVTADGRPHVAIVNPAVEGDTVWISTFRSAKKARNISANAYGSLVWSGEAEVYVDVTVEPVDDLPTKRRLWDGTWGFDPAMFFERPDHPDYLLLRCTPFRALVLAFGPDGPTASRWSASA